MLSSQTLRRRFYGTRISLSVLLAVGIASDVRAQVPFSQLRPPIPTREAAQQLAREMPQPTDQVLIRFQSKSNAEAARFGERFSRTSAAQSVQRSGQGKLPALRWLHSHSAIGWHVYKISDASRLAAALAALRQNPDVLQAIPDQHLRLLADPPSTHWGKSADDYLFGQYVASQGLVSGDARDFDSAYWTYSWHLETVKAAQAWNLYPGSYPNAAQHRLIAPSHLPLVAVIDTGFDFDHPSFANAGGANSDVSAGGQVQTDLACSILSGVITPGTSVAGARDAFGHGTSVAGVIGAAPNGGDGLPGLGFPCRLVPIRIYGSNGDGFDSDLSAAVMYAADSGCLLVNISARTDFGYSSALQDAVNYAWDKGTLVIAAIGNDGGTGTDPTTRRYPASLEHVLAVGASTYGGSDAIPAAPYTAPDADGIPTDAYYTGPSAGGEALASYSNYGQNAGVVAPAGDVTTFDNDAPQADDPFLQAVASALGVASGLPQFNFVYTTAPTYTVPLSDPNDTTNGSYAALGVYGLNYGEVPGTSFAAPLVTGLAALYAAKNGITQATPNAPQRILQAIERGADALDSTQNGGFSTTFGWGRINALATLQDKNNRNATVGGIVGTVYYNGLLQGGLGIKATRIDGAGSGTASTTADDGVYHLLNLPAGTYRVSAANSVPQTLTVTPGCDTQGLDFAVAPLEVSGIVTLEGSVNLAQPVTFTFRANPAGPADIVYTTTLGADGSFGFQGLPLRKYSVAIQGSKWLRKTVAINGLAGNVANLNVTLLAGDATGSNIVDFDDFLVLLYSFGAKSSVPGSGYDVRADFDCNGIVDYDDFLLLLNNFGVKGDN